MSETMKFKKNGKELELPLVEMSDRKYVGLPSGEWRRVPEPETWTK
jgi:hypothetical protein